MLYITGLSLMQLLVYVLCMYVCIYTDAGENITPITFGVRSNKQYLRCFQYFRDKQTLFGSYKQVTVKQHKI